MDTSSVRDAYVELARRPADSGLEPLLRDWDELWATVREDEIELKLAIHRGDAAPSRMTEWSSGPGQARNEGERALVDRVLTSDALDRLPPEFEPFLRQLRRERRLCVAANDALEAEIGTVGSGWWKARERWQPAADAHSQTCTEDTWRALGAARAAVADEVSDLWSTLAARRELLARNAGFDDFTGYCWAFLGREWTPADADALCERVRTHVVPVLAELEGPVAPWEQQSGPAPDDLLGTVIAGLRELGPELAELAAEGDVEIARTQRGGAFHTWRPRSRRSMVMMRPSGREGDLQTLVHETGHALHSRLSRIDAPMRAVDLPLEVAELASVGLERLFDPSEEGVRRTLRMICSSTAAHRFQRWAYAQPEATAAQRNARWAEEWRTFFPHYRVRDESGAGWVGFPHITLYPYYCLEYTLAGLGALGLRRSLAEDRAGTLRSYIAFLHGRPGLPAVDAYALAGVPLLPDSAQMTRVLADLPDLRTPSRSATGT